MAKIESIKIGKELTASWKDGRVIKCTFFVTSHLDRDQVRVSEISPTEFRVKCGRMLTDQEVKGAIVKYMLAKRTNEQTNDARAGSQIQDRHGAGPEGLARGSASDRRGTVSSGERLYLPRYRQQAGGTNAPEHEEHGESDSGTTE